MAEKIVCVEPLPLETITHGPSLVGLASVVRVRADGTDHVVRIYRDRLAVHHGERLSWEWLAAIKDAIWGETESAVEVFPPKSEVINMRPTRHLWRSSAVASLVDDISRGLHANHRPAAESLRREGEAGEFVAPGSDLPANQYLHPTGHINVMFRASDAGIWIRSKHDDHRMAISIQNIVKWPEGEPKRRALAYWAKEAPASLCIDGNGTREMRRDECRDLVTGKALALHVVDQGERSIAQIYDEGDNGSWFHTPGRDDYTYPHPCSNPGQRLRVEGFLAQSTSEGEVPSGPPLDETVDGEQRPRPAAAVLTEAPR